MNRATPMVSTAICPHCWASFPPEDVVWISAHADLLGDPKIGPEHQRRFLPLHFDVQGRALDARGFPCHLLACPSCHLAIPRSVVETDTFFVSVFGEEECGKSFFLTALTWELRRQLPRLFGLAFSDADLVSNQTLTAGETRLFLSPRADELIPLEQLVPKTAQDGDGYDPVRFGAQQVFFPCPYLFSVRPRENHPRFSQRERLTRLVCFYDNPGERFRPGADSAAHPDTRHLAVSSCPLFLFDPTQDARFFALLKQDSERGLIATRATRQQTVLQEAEHRMHASRGALRTEKESTSFTIVVTKFDLWSDLIGRRDLVDPWIHVGELAGLDVDRIDQASQEVRDLLLNVCPEIVEVAEEIWAKVDYIPVSALGRVPEEEPDTGKPAVRPREIRPTWVTVPLLLAISRQLPGLVAVVRRRPGHDGEPVASPPRLNSLPDR